MVRATQDEHRAASERLAEAVADEERIANRHGEWKDLARLLSRMLGVPIDTGIWEVLE